MTKYSIYDKHSELYSVFTSPTNPVIRRKQLGSYLVPLQADAIEIPSDASPVGVNSTAQGFIVGQDEARNAPIVANRTRSSEFWWSLFIIGAQAVVWKILTGRKK